MGMEINEGCPFCANNQEIIDYLQGSLVYNN